MARRAAAILRRFTDVHVVVVPGRNAALKRRLDRLAVRSGGRLTVTGYVDNMSDWLRCCDLIVTKAGPGTIGEATCCGTPLLLTGHIPGQEKGNAEIVTGAGAGLWVPGVRQLVAEIGRLRRDRGAIEAMGAASVRLGLRRRRRHCEADRRPDPGRRRGSASGLVRPALTELRLRRAARPLTERWRQLPVPSRGAARLGISFRPLQAAALGLDPDEALRALLAYPFQLIRLGAYWDRLEPRPGEFRPGELDRQLDAAERAGKQVIVCLGAVKTFGYPEFFVPGHHLRPAAARRLPGPA